MPDRRGPVPSRLSPALAGTRADRRRLARGGRGTFLVWLGSRQHTRRCIAAASSARFICAAASAAAAAAAPSGVEGSLARPTRRPGFPPTCMPLRCRATRRPSSPARDRSCRQRRDPGRERGRGAPLPGRGGRPGGPSPGRGRAPPTAPPARPPHHHRHHRRRGPFGCRRRGVLCCTMRVQPRRKSA